MNINVLQGRLKLACHWIVDVAQVKSEKLNNEIAPRKHKYWRGAIRGEYSVAKKEWRFFCPIWHTGQAVKALVAAYSVFQDKSLLDAAKLGAKFIISNQVIQKTNSDFGLILAYEDFPDKINTSAILESLDGLIALSELTNENKWWQSVLWAAEWVKRKAYRGKGLFFDVYDPSNKSFLGHSSFANHGRPLLDDGIFLKVYKKTKDKRFRNIFFETTDRLLKEEAPPGNWIKYPPCNAKRGNIHPRQAYWWGLPMIAAYKETESIKYLDCAKRCGEWYTKAQRRDGGLFRGTYDDFNTDSFGHATSGIACAMILWQELDTLTNTTYFKDSFKKALDFCLNMQFVNPTDTNLKGAILEKVLYPDGTDGSPYHIRDLGTIFFIQAVSKFIPGGSNVKF